MSTPLPTEQVNRMNSDDLFWGLIWKCVLAAFLGLVVTIGGCTFGQYAVYAHSMNIAVEKGANTMLVGCAFGVHQSDGDAAICAQAIGASHGQ